MLLSLGLHLIVYRINFNFENISNVLFVLGMLAFLPSLIVQTGSYEMFYGIRYSMQVLFRKDFRKQYPSFTEFRTEKMVTYETSIFLETMIASSVIIIIAIILARLVTL